MKKYALLFVTLWFLVVPCRAQDEQQPTSEFDWSSLKRFEENANRRQDTLLFKSFEYTAPYSGLYFVLTLDKDGNAFGARVVAGSAVQNSRRAKLSPEQVEEVKRMLAAPYFRSPPSPAAPQSGERYTAFVFLKGGDYARVDYVGALPAGVREVVDFVNAEVEKQERLRYEKWLEEQRRNTPPASPPGPERSHRNLTSR